MIFWGNADIQTRQPSKMIEKIEKFYMEYQNLKKSMKNKSKTFLAKESTFVEKLDNLIQQREKGQPGEMTGLNVRQRLRTQTAAPTATKNLLKYKPQALPTPAGGTTADTTTTESNTSSSMYDTS